MTFSFSKPLRVASGIVVISVGLFALWFWHSRPYHNYPLQSANRSRVDSLGRPIIQPNFADIPYSNESTFQKLDLYLPSSGGKAPVIVWIHGGGLIMGDKLSMPRADFGPPPKPVGNYGPYQVQVPDVELALKHGFAVVSLNYRLGMSVFTAAGDAISDVKTAVRFLRANAEKYSLDPSRIALWGNSMGGYLAAMAGASGDQYTKFDDIGGDLKSVSPAVSAVIVWYGAEDKMPGEKLSIAHYIRLAKKLPAFLIVNGDADPVISVKSATDLKSELDRVRAFSKLVILKGAGHEDPQFMETQVAPAIEFLESIESLH